MRKLGKIGTSLMALAMGLSVAVGIGTNKVMEANAADTPLVALTFPDDNKDKNKVSSYAAEWTAIIGDYSFDIKGFNNNNWSGWKYIKCGNKNNTSKNTITNTSAFSSKISKISITVDACNAKVNSVTLKGSSDKENWSDLGTFIAKGSTTTVGTLSVDISNPQSNYYYQIMFDCAKDSNNGSLQLSNVSYFSDGGTPIPPEPEEDSITITGGNQTITLPQNLDDASVKYTCTGDGELGYTKVSGDDGIANLSLNNGTVTITPSKKGSAVYKLKKGDAVSENTISLTVTDPVEQPKYTLVTDASVLKKGDNLLIVGNDGESYYALAPYVSGNNCKRNEIPAPVNNVITSDVAYLTLGGSNDAWTLFDGTYYLYAAGASSSNYLKGQTSASADTAKWTITSEDDGKATIKCVANISRNTIKHNADATGLCFSCYASSSSQKPVYIYRAESATPSTEWNVFYNGNNATSGTVPTDSKTYTPSDNTVTVLGNTGSLVRTGFTFVGWNTQADGEGTSYVAGNTFTISDDVTLYAEWEAAKPVSAVVKTHPEIVYLNETIDTKDVKMTVTYSDGSSGDVDATSVTCDTSTVGTKTATAYVTADIYDTFSIEVKIKTDTTITISERATALDWKNGEAYINWTDKDGLFKFTGNSTGNNYKYYSSDESFRMYNGGSLTVESIQGYTITEISSSPASNFKIAADGMSATASYTATVQIKSFTIKFELVTSCSLYFNRNGLSEDVTMPETQTYDKGATVIVPGAPANLDTKAYTWLGWSLDKEGTEIVTSFTITSTKTLYAQYIYIGKGSESNPFTPEEMIAFYDEYISKGQFVDDIYYVSGVVGKSKYNSSYSNFDYIYFVGHTDEDQTPVELFRVKYGTGVSHPTDNNLVNYTVVCKGKITKYNDTYEIGSDGIITDVKLEETYSVTFSNNGHGQAPAKQEGYQKGDLITKPTDPSCEGFIFGGWYKDIECTEANKWNFDTDTINNSLTLYAKWTFNRQSDLNSVQTFMNLGYKYEKTGSSTSTFEQYDGTQTIEKGDQIYFRSTFVDNEGKTTYYAPNHTYDNKKLGAVEITDGLNPNNETIFIVDVNSKGEYGIYFLDESGKPHYLNLSATSDVNNFSDSFVNLVLVTNAKGNGFSNPNKTSNTLCYRDGYGFKNYAFSNMTDTTTEYSRHVDIFVKKQSKAYDNVDFRFKLGVNGLSDFADSVGATDWGIVLTTESGLAKSKTVYFSKDGSTSPMYTDEATGYKYFVLNLGDVLNNMDRTEVEFTIRPYVVVDGERIVSSKDNPTTWSVKSIVSHFYNDMPETRQYIADLYNILFPGEEK